MDSRELYPSDEQRRRIMDFIMAAGETLLENGAEVFRVEQTMEIMARSFHPVSYTHLTLPTKLEV